MRRLRCRPRLRVLQCLHVADEAGERDLLRMHAEADLRWLRPPEADREVTVVSQVLIAERVESLP